MLVVKVCMHVNMNSQYDHNKKTPLNNTCGKPIKFLFQVSISTLKVQCLVTKGNIASIGSDNTNCLTSNPAFIDFQPAKQSNLLMQTKLTNTRRSMAPTSFQSRVKHFQLMYFPCLLWFGNSDHGQYILLTSLPQMCGVWFWKGSGLAHYCNAPHFQFGWSQLRAASTSA